MKYWFWSWLTGYTTDEIIAFEVALGLWVLGLVGAVVLLLCLVAAKQRLVRLVKRKWSGR